MDYQDATLTWALHLPKKRIPFSNDIFNKMKKPKRMGIRLMSWSRLFCSTFIKIAGFFLSFLNRKTPTNQTQASLLFPKSERTNRDVSSETHLPQQRNPNHAEGKGYSFRLSAKHGLSGHSHRSNV